MNYYSEAAIERIENFLIENVPTGKGAAAAFAAKHGGIKQRTTKKQAQEIRAAAKAPKVVLPEPKEREKRKGVQVPSRGILPSEEVLRGKSRRPGGLAQTRKNTLSKLLLATTDQATYDRIQKRIAGISAALKNKKNWGKQRSLNNDVEYVLDYLLSEGFVDSYEDGIYMVELMTTEFLSGILIESL